MTEKTYPDANTIHPIQLPDGTSWTRTVFLKNVIDHPNIEIGDYSYFSALKTPDDWAVAIAPYIYPGAPEKLVIGKFVQIAYDVQFVTSSATHQMDGFSTFPFTIFGESWANNYQPNFPNKGDTIVGHDVWIGHKALIMPGVTIGNGAIIGSGSVVTKDVPPYHIVAGNPATIIRSRFENKTIQALQKIAWWNWPYEVITENLEAITGADIEQLRHANSKVR